MKILFVCLVVSVFAEKEAMSALPSEARLNPKFYESEEEAKKAAEKELALMGESVEGSKMLTGLAEIEALKIAQDAERDPMHDGLEGVKVDLGEMEDPIETAKKN